MRRDTLNTGFLTYFSQVLLEVTITPLDEASSSKTTLVARLKYIKETLKLSNYTLADKIGVNESTVRRWLDDTMLPTETRIPKIIEILTTLEAEKDAPQRTAFHRRAETEDTTEPYM